MEIKTFYDKTTGTFTYIAYDASTKDAIVVDPVLNYDPKSGVVSYESAKELTGFIDSNNLNIHYIFETHAHADHLSSARHLKNKHYKNAKIAIGAGIVTVQKTFKAVFNFPEDFKTDGSQFDRLVADGDVLEAGSLKFDAISTPGHTPACTSLLSGSVLFAGDTIFMPDFGTGRCDFPMGSAEALYSSVTKKIYTLPETTKVFVGHDYATSNRDAEYQTTVGDLKAKNIQLTAETKKEDFVKFRTERDATLDAPVLIFPSVQVNIAAGEFPRPESNGTTYLKVPVTFSEHK